MAAPPIVCPGRYANVTAAFLAEPTPPGNDSTYPVHNNLNIPTLQNDYFAFADVEISTAMESTKLYGAWSQFQGTYGGPVGGQVRLSGFVPAQTAMGLYVGRRIMLTHSWAWTDPVTSTAYSKTGSVPVKITKSTVSTRVNDTMRVSLEAEFDYRRVQPANQNDGNYIWDNTRQVGSFGYRNITPDPKSDFPFKV